MATVNKRIGGMGGLTVTIDYDDGSLRVLAFHIVNTDSRSYTISATSTANGKNYSFTVQANTTIDQNVPSGAANRLQLFVNANGKLDGLDWRIS